MDGAAVPFPPAISLVTVLLSVAPFRPCSSNMPRSGRRESASVRTDNPVRSGPHRSMRNSHSRHPNVLQLPCRFALGNAKMRVMSARHSAARLRGSPGQACDPWCSAFRSGKLHTPRTSVALFYRAVYACRRRRT